ncbi:Lysine-specific demethylase 8 [Rhizoclosmatium sp. JEL0117]|nr:Lysine-specific demethylase 8 [Rhizoclosmatium sp. JEL0117]
MPKQQHITWTQVSSSSPLSLSSMPISLSLIDSHVGLWLRRAHLFVSICGVSKSSAAKAKAAKAAEKARDVAIEAMEKHGDHVHVLAYAAASMFVAAAQLQQSPPNPVAALRAIDLALIRGGIADWSSIARPLIVQATNMLKGNELGKETPKVQQTKTKTTRKDPPRPSQYLTTPNVKDIPRIDARSLSADEFCKRYMLANPPQPVILTNVIGSWPACTKWKDLNYLKSVTAGRLVPVETTTKQDAGRSFLSESWSHRVIPLDEYISQFVQPDGAIPSSEPDYEDLHGYLAQHQLLDQIPQLRDDIDIPRFCSAHTPEDDATPFDCEYRHDPLVSAWFGPAGTVSPLHNDPYHNVLAQIVGSKYIRIYDAKDTDAVYPESNRLGHNSRVDIDAPFSEIRSKFPLFVDAPCWQTILKEGELLYMPRHVWHYVRSLETSFSASFWFGAKMELVKNKKSGKYETKHLKMAEKGKSLNIQ